MRGGQHLPGRWSQGDVVNLMGDATITQPGQGFATGAAAVVAVDLESSGQDSAAKQGFDRTNQAVGAAAHTFCGTGANGDITIHGGAAAQAEVRRTVGQIDLFNVAAGGEVRLPFKHLHHAGAALTNATAVVEIVKALVGIDACIKCSLTQICALDAANLLAFLLESDGGHGFRKSTVRTNLQASGLIKGLFPEINRRH